ncbi:MAG: ABC transporter substrate-binding protein [Dehalococcoidia bacterium]|nr:MAG: ABC transporter substrate-binding protein [Dehalococcoidia bacterium]
MRATRFVQLPGKASCLLAVLLLASLVAILLIAACEEEQKEGEGPSPTTTTPTVTLTPAAEVPGITDTEIILGTHGPLSGFYGAVYAPVMQSLQAYFEYVNAEQGGVCGRKIVLKVEDDSFEPAKAAGAVRELVERDNVFAIVAGVGTAPHSGVWEYLNELGIPDLWIMSGAHKWAADPEAHPWSVGFLPDYVVEGTVFGKYISENLAGKKVAVLYENTDAGWDRLAGLKNGLDPNKNELASEQSFELTDASVFSQVANMKNSGAEVTLCFTLPGFCAQAIKGSDRLGWHSQWFIAYTNADPVMFRYVSPELMEGVLSLQGNKMYDWTDDPAIMEHYRIMEEYGGPTPSAFTVAGHSVAGLTVEALSRTCDNLTREGLMDAVESFKDYQGDLALPGITITLSETDHLAVEAMRMLRATLVGGEGKWEYFGELISFAD